MTGIREIAIEAGVSPATVSRVIRNPELVSKERRQRVQAVIDRTGYTPNSLGVSLRKAKTNRLVAIIPDAISAFNYPVIRAMESIALENGYSLLLGDTQEMETRERSFAAMVSSRQADGILLFCPRLPFDVEPSIPLANQLPPMVNACELVPVNGLPQVNIDNRAAARDGVEYLLSLGHTRIGVIAGNLKSPSTKDRLAGYKDALRQAGLAIDEQCIDVGDYGLEKSEQATRRLMKQPQPPTAIFAFSDEMAMACIATLCKSGYRVPDDISVLGFDNISYANYCNPSLTTIAQPMSDIGRVCMELLLPQLRGEPMVAQNIVLDHTLIIRESTGPVKT
ncbi:LacI family DNA-binding transcriptional regulator [Gilvimarinus algae]|uniref:LacI family DNA-binding transcriptional regulator n=1 Tax=Gilvimarinus algae TaxID=3058037 RepID=A0ABT8TBR5_9GAMM|nr:LacI family DNA-binding transcriptional regulator [Gilvimarinus sp. SDUM040014]MDO3381360.1 LacI family DNA-binding transcriptional regulator [Gilvimarinus sp. SDUM040014]